MWLDADGNSTAALPTTSPGGSLRALRIPSSSYTAAATWSSCSRFGTYGNDIRLNPEHLLIHSSGLNKDSVKETPAYELARRRQGVRTKALGTLVREAAVGVAKPEDVDTFLRTPNLTLAQADAWLEGQSPRRRLTIGCRS